MTDSFDRAVSALLRLEGGPSNHPADAGGLTKYGITLAFYRRLPPPFGGGPAAAQEDLLRLTEPQARLIYRREFWDRYRCADLPPDVGAAFFLTLVNLPPTEAVKVLQRAIRRAGGDPRLAVDGRLGPATRAGAARCDQTELKRRFTAESCLYYADRVRARPSNQAFLAGWFYRAACLFIDPPG